MKRNVADNVAMGMKTVLNSPEYQSIFKTASEKEDEKDKDMAKDEQCADDKDKADMPDADDCSMADDSSLDALAQYDVAIDSLLTASAALDEIGTETGSKAVIKLAHIIVLAKKKKVEEKSKGKKDKKEDKDKNMAKDKKDKDKKDKEDKKGKKPAWLNKGKK